MVFAREEGAYTEQVIVGQLIFSKCGFFFGGRTLNVKYGFYTGVNHLNFIRRGFIKFYQFLLCLLANGNNLIGMLGRIARFSFVNLAVDVRILLLMF